MQDNFCYILKLFVGQIFQLGHVWFRRSPVVTKTDLNLSNIIIPSSSSSSLLFSKNLKNTYFYFLSFSSEKRNRRKNKQHFQFTLDFLFFSRKRNGFRFFSRKSSLRFHFHSLCLSRVSSLFFFFLIPNSQRIIFNFSFNFYL